MAERDPQIGPGRQAASYGADYSTWIAAQAALLQAGRFGELDIVHLVDEVEGLGKSEFYGFASAIEIVLVHMLKWDIQPRKRSPSWVASIVEHRRRIEQALLDNPSFKARLDEAVARAWRTASPKAAAEANLPLGAFPDQNPFDWEAITSRPHELPAPARRNRKNA